MDVLNCVPDNRLGGPQKASIEIATEIRNYGIETSFLIPGLDENRFVESIESGGFQHTMVDIPRIRAPKQLRQNARFLSSWRGKTKAVARVIAESSPDLVYIYGPLNLIPAYAASRTDVPVVWHFNDTLTPPPLKQLTGWLASRWADRIVVSADAVRSYYFNSRAPTATLYPPVRVPRFSTATGDDELRDELGIDDDVPIVGSVGNINPAKGYEHFIDAVDRIAAKEVDIEAVIVGAKLESRMEYHDRLVRKIEEFGLEERVTLLGFREDIPALLSSFDLFVLPSVSEACPIVVLEAMAAKCPVVATRVGGVPEELPDEEHGWLVPPRDADRLAEAIRAALASPARREAVAEQAFERVTEEFSVETCTARHFELYESVA